MVSKNQTFSDCQLEDLPDEIIYIKFGHLEARELVLCVQVSKRYRTISHDESLWRGTNLYQHTVGL